MANVLQIADTVLCGVFGGALGGYSPARVQVENMDMDCIKMFIQIPFTSATMCPDFLWECCPLTT